MRGGSGGSWPLHFFKLKPKVLDDDVGQEAVAHLPYLRLGGGAVSLVDPHFQILPGPHALDGSVAHGAKAPGDGQALGVVDRGFQCDVDASQEHATYLPPGPPRSVSRKSPGISGTSSPQFPAAAPGPVAPGPNRSGSTSPGRTACRSWAANGPGGNRLPAQN